MTISVQKFEGSVYVVIGHIGVYLTRDEARELMARLGRALDEPKTGN